MNTISLNGAWKFRQKGDDSWLPATVPGCAHTDLLAADQIPDPYYRDNENHLKWIGETDWFYSRKFLVPAEFLNHSQVLLQCHSLDTLATISLNGQVIGKTNNQFRTWEFDIKDLLEAGENEINILFESALIYGQNRLKERDIHQWGAGAHKLPGGNYVRKSPCNFGWDWGPKLVTCGILGDIQLVGFDQARLDNVHIQQLHKAGQVTLTCEIQAATDTNQPLEGQLSLTFAGEECAASRVMLVDGKGLAEFTIENPRLWWPNGMGDQPLYQMSVRLMAGEDILDSTVKRIGLRTLRLIREKDAWGESFHFECNGVPFFAKGSNWIPADTFVTRLTKDDYARLLMAAKDTHQNMLRVWGGGIYEPDIFYDLCDQLGITVWQDFMFACATYPVFDDDFMVNVHEEAIQQIKRLRNHASLALWCGNNELEQGLVAKEWTETTMSWEDYGRLFDEMLPSLVAEMDPQTDYWPGSPHSPQGDRHDWNNPQWGDAHIWDVWHGLEPFEFYRTCMHRFNSEFGFQSFPEPRTVDTYTIPSDHSINSPVMEHHQRSGNGNAAIIHYLLDWFRLPTNFNHQLFLSQILQGMAIKYAVEHWRRTMPRGMGTLYWQLNDCWPVASWASIDYFGRWKALHYMARNFFAPLLISGEEDWENGWVEVHITNDHQADFSGSVHWKLISADEGKGIIDGQIPVEMPKLGSNLAATLDFGEQLQVHGNDNLILILALLTEGRTVSENLVLFCRPKQLKLKDPKLKLDVQDQKLSLSSKSPALWTWIDIDSEDTAPLSDNFFHIMPGKSKLIDIPKELIRERSLEKVRAYSLWDTFQEAE